MKSEHCHAIFLGALLALSLLPAAGMAQAPAARAREPVSVVTPVYSQLVMFTYPAGFRPANQRTSGNQYTQESVLEGETLEKWTQMLTLTGNKGLASNPKATPQRTVELIASGFQKACPGSHAAKPLGPVKVSGHDAFAAITGCGSIEGSGATRASGPHSEVVLILAIKGSSDYYTLQWAERAAQSGQPPVLDENRWLARLAQLGPIKVCNRIPDEKPPFPSCAKQK